MIFLGGIELKISEISEITGLESSTLRYYEEIGLIRDIRKNSSGIRAYTADDLAWIKFVAAMKTAGLAIADIKKFGELYYNQNEDFNDRLCVAKECYDKLLIEKRAIEKGIRFIQKKIAFYESMIVDKEKSNEN